MWLCANESAWAALGVSEKPSHWKERNWVRSSDGEFIFGLTSDICAPQCQEKNKFYILLEHLPSLAALKSVCSTPAAHRFRVCGSGACRKFGRETFGSKNLGGANSYAACMWRAWILWRLARWFNQFLWICKVRLWSAPADDRTIAQNWCLPSRSRIDRGKKMKICFPTWLIQRAHSNNLHPICGSRWL